MVAPTGITVLPSSITGSETRPEKLSPALLPSVESASVRRIFTAVPVRKLQLLLERGVSVSGIHIGGCGNRRFVARLEPRAGFVLSVKSGRG